MKGMAIDCFVTSLHRHTLQNQNCFQFLTVYFEAAEFPVVGRSGMLCKTFKFRRYWFRIAPPPPPPPPQGEA